MLGIMLHYMKYYIDNNLVKVCLLNATGRANTIIGYKLALFIEQFSVNNLDIEHRKIVTSNYLHNILLMLKAGSQKNLGFDSIEF